MFVYVSLAAAVSGQHWPSTFHVLRRVSIQQSDRKLARERKRGRERDRDGGGGSNRQTLTYLATATAATFSKFLIQQVPQIPKNPFLPKLQKMTCLSWFLAAQCVFLLKIPCNQKNYENG